MKETGIIMSTPMLKATLEDRKTCTRRLYGLKKINENPDDWNYVKDLKSGASIAFYKVGKPINTKELLWIKCPYGQVGDRLWVRETWKYLDREHLRVAYKASIDTYTDGVFVRLGNWHPSIHLFKKDARIWLEITGLKVERVQEIREEDAEAEGESWSASSGENPEIISAIENYAYLWDSLNAKRGYSWESNPFVWVIEFKRIDNG